MRTPKERYDNYPLLARAFEKWNSRLRKRTKQEQDEEKDAPAWIRWYLTEAGMTPASIRKAVRTFTGTQAVSAFSPAQAAAIRPHATETQPRLSDLRGRVGTRSPSPEEAQEGLPAWRSHVEVPGLPTYF